jgi:hypothetical protein
VWSYHLINFLLHLLNGILVFVLAERTFRILGADTTVTAVREAQARERAASNVDRRHFRDSGSSAVIDRRYS